MYFKISLETSSLGYLGDLFSFQVYGEFFVIFLLLISSLISLWSEKLHNLNSSKFVEVCLLQGRGYFWYMFSGNLKRKCILQSLGGVFC